MKTTITLAALLLAGVLNAAPEKGKGDRKGKPPGVRPGLPAEIIKKFDTDGDGKLSDEEKKKAREAMQAAARERREAFIKQYDTDGDGKLSKEEMKAAHEDMKKKHEEFVKKHDKDGDGKLSKEELIAAFDTDGDGELSADERAAMREAMPRRPRPQGRRPGGDRGRPEGRRPGGEGRPGGKKK